MNNNSIVCNGISKKYVIGSHIDKTLTFAEALVDSIKHPSKFITRRLSESDFWALKDISFEVKQGETLGIIGRNGSGKSTLLKILSRITSPTSGEAIIYGKMVSLLEVGTGFHPDLTGRENIFLNGAILGMPHKEVLRKFDEIVDFSGIEEFIDTPVKKYSSGMYVRLAFSIAAHVESEIVIFDEVLAVGDSKFQEKSLNKISDIATSGRTVLFVSHEMGALKSLCKKAIVLDKGKIIYRSDDIEKAAEFYENRA